MVRTGLLTIYLLDDQVVMGWAYGQKCRLPQGKYDFRKSFRCNGTPVTTHSKTVSY
jgi:hypothetical protein